MKLRTRIALTFSAINLVTLIVSFSFLILLVRRDEMRELDAALDAQALEAARFALVQKADEHDLPSGPGEIPDALTLSPRYVALYDTNGRLRSANATFGAHAPASLGAAGIVTDVPHESQSEGRHERATFDLMVGDDALRGVVVPLGRDGKTLLYAMSRRSVDRDLRYLSEVCLVLALLAIAITWLVARGVGRLLSREIDSIAEVARAVSGGDLSARVGTAPMRSPETQTLGEDLDRMIAQLVLRITAERKFIAHAAHELRSPLATLRGELQLGLRRPRDADGYRAAIGHALTEVELLSALAEDLLVLARAQSEQDRKQERTTLSEIIGSALRMARAAADARAVTLESEIRADVATAVVGSRSSLSRALHNLIDNAIRHSAEGGRVTIDVGRERAQTREDDAIILSVSDQGDGVSDADAPHLFTPFWRGNSGQSGETNGAGLGLSIAREIARAYGGELEFDASRKPKERGARFVLRLAVGAQVTD